MQAEAASRFGSIAPDTREPLRIGIRAELGVAGLAGGMSVQRSDDGTGGVVPAVGAALAHWMCS